MKKNFVCSLFPQLSVAAALYAHTLAMGAPSITANPSSLGDFSTTEGTASNSQSFSVNGSGLTEFVTVTAPANFEVSTSNLYFSPSLTLPSPGGEIQSVYGGDYNVANSNVWYVGNGQEFPNGGAFAAITSERSVVTWGIAFNGGDSTSVADRLSSEVKDVYSNFKAFAALKNDGSVVTWGRDDHGGDSTSVASQISSDVTAVYSTAMAFAAMKSDGSVVTWGYAPYGGDSSSVSGSLTSDVTKVFSNAYAFAALKSDGSVVTWGSGNGGGNSTSVSGSLSSNVSRIFSNAEAFAALKSDGSLVTWGNNGNGGNSASVASQLASDVVSVQPTQRAFAALKSNGSVVTWGESGSGGDSTRVAGSLTSNVTRVFSNPWAFAAVKSDGSVVTWGKADSGGDSTIMTQSWDGTKWVYSHESIASLISSNVETISSNERAFAALKDDGSVVTWGFAIHGGNSSSVASQLSSNVTAIYSSASAFAALKSDGSVVTWGSADSGGDSSAVASQLASNVTAIYSTASAFAALKSDGTLVTWGGWGGDGGPANIGAPSSLPATVYTRISSSALVGPVSGSITLASPGVSNQSVALSGVVGPAPTVYASPSSLGSFATLEGTASASQSFTVNGTLLNGGITVTAPRGYEISADNTEFSSSLVLESTGGNVADVVLYTRIASDAQIGPISGNITLSSLGATTKTVSVDGMVSGVPTISVSPSGIENLTTTSGSASGSLSFNVEGMYLVDNLTIIAPGGFQVSVDNNHFSSGLSLPVGSGWFMNSIYTRIAPEAPVGSVAGNITLTSEGATTRTVALSGVVTAGPSITPSVSSLQNFFAGDGIASSSQSFTINASELNEPVIVSAPPGFQVSSDNITFANSITILPSDGNVPAVTVYTRLAADASRGLVSGNITITSGSSYITRTTADGLASNLVNSAFASGSTVYAATFPGINGGLGISTDGGATFINRNTANSNLPNNYVNDVHVVDNTIFVATNGGLCISTDGGNSFTTRTTADGLGSNFVRGVFAVGNSVYASTNNGLSISTNNGSTFINRNTTNGLSSTALEDAQAVGNTIYAAMSSFSPPGGVGISTNGGASFTTRSTANGLGSPNVWDIFVVDNTIYAATGGGLSISTDGGANFTNRTTAHGLGHNNVNGVYVVGSTVYAATSGGLSISYDGGSTFTNRTTANGLASNGLFSVFVNENKIYLATSVGLTIIAPGGPTGITSTVAVSGQVQSVLSLPGSKGNNTLSNDYVMTDGYAIKLGLFADYLVVAGGGGGAGSGTDTTAWGGGGGGAGGLLQGSDYLLSPGNHAVTVGAGGAGGQRNGNTSLQQGSSGGNSSFVSLTAIGGGGGGAYKLIGGVGGSGGGGGGRATTAGGSGTTGQGFAGGTARGGDNSGRSAGGGGGGASTAGGNGAVSASNAGNGGNGTASSITGSSTFYAGGGGGGAIDTNSGASETAGLGGLGGGGNGSTVGNGGAGTNGLGGGGGGVGHQGVGGNGGSGLVVVRYKGEAVASGGVVSAGQGTAAGFTLHTFSSPGNATLSLTSEGLTSLQTTLNGNISGTGGISFDGPGTLVLAGTNSFSGATVVSSGTLQLGDGGTTGTVTGPIINNSQLAIHRSDDLDLTNEISGSGALVKLGSNTLTLASTVQGSVSVNSGEVRVTGSVGSVAVKSGGSLSGTGSTGTVSLVSGASISPGNGGLGALSTGSVSLQGGSVWNWETNSTNGTAGVNSDFIESSGELVLNASAENPIAFNIFALDDFSLSGVRQASWVVGRFSGGINGFTTRAFSIHAGGLVIPTGGAFTMALGADNTLVLLYQTPQIIASASTLGNFTTLPGDASTSKSFIVSGNVLLGAVTATAPLGYELSLDNSAFSSSVEVNTPAGFIETVERFKTGSGNIWSAGNGQEFPNEGAFAAITSKGSVVTWGAASQGGDSSSVSEKLSSNVRAVYSNKYAFAALKADGSVVTWGDAESGGDSSSVAAAISSNVTAVYSTVYAFAALKSDGSVVTWGNATYGGNSSAVSDKLSSNVRAIYSNAHAFAALKSDGSLVTWGNATNGGDSSSVSDKLSTNVKAVYSNTSAFAALKSDGSVVTWGLAQQGGDSTSVAGLLSSNVTGRILIANATGVKLFKILLFEFVRC